MRDGWEKRRLTDALRLQNGFPFKPSDLGTVGLPVVRIKELMDASLECDRSTAKIPEAMKIDSGDVIFSWSGRLEAVRWTRGPAALNQHLFKVTPLRGELLSGFALLALQHAIPSMHLHGTTMKHVTKEELARVELGLPPLREQRRIVDLVGTLDDAIAAAEASAAATDTLSQRARDALPDGTIRPMGEVLMGIESGTSTKPVGGDGEKVFVLTLAAIRPGRFHRSEIKDVGAAALPTKARLVESDLLITRSNTPDRVGYVCVARDVPDNTYIPDLVWRLVTDERHVTKDYLEQALSSTRLREAITGSASGTSQSMRKINKAGFARIQVPIPGIAVQEAYVAPLRQLAGVRAEYDSHLARLRVLRSNMLAALLSGEHEIPESYDELMGAAS